MRTLIIPDIHNKTERTQRIIDAVPADRRIFLGDIYDDFGDTLTDIERTAIWHKQALADPANTFLFGNHDMPYAFPGNRFLRCSGYALDKQAIITDIVSFDLRDKSKLFTTCDGWFISHAGLARKYQGDDIVASARDALSFAPAGLRHALTGAGQARGGSQEVGGLTWLDWNYEFKPVRGIKQIVGHTPGLKPRMIGGTKGFGPNWNLDTHLQHYGILNDGHLQIFAVSELGVIS